MSYLKITKHLKDNNILTQNGKEVMNIIQFLKTSFVSRKEEKKSMNRMENMEVWEKNV